jgi:hypothetical protein
MPQYSRPIAPWVPWWQATVRTVFRLYVDYGTVRQVKAEADRLGIKTKIRNGG